MGSETLLLVQSPRQQCLYVFFLSLTAAYYPLSQAIWCLSGDDSLQQRGATTGIDYMVLYENYLKLITNGLQHNKAEFINVIQQWDEAVFPGTETSIVAGKTSSSDTENEIDKEIERMNDEDLL
jgi:hypothetical protein